MTDREREERALDALIVLALRSPPDYEDVDPDSLPELTPEEIAAIERIDIEAIIARSREIR